MRMRKGRGGGGEMADDGQAGARERDEAAAEELLELVAHYKDALAELTFNSKPIITNLTIIAGENAHAAYGITKTICDHIVMVPKEQKLPSLYLLDSIVKNIGGEYVKYFAARLPEVKQWIMQEIGQSKDNARTVSDETYARCSMQLRNPPGLVGPTACCDGRFRELHRNLGRGLCVVGPLKTIETELELSPKPGGPAAGNLASRGAEAPARPGHGIHVNPKYLEQRQLLQQSRTSRADGVGPAESNGDGLLRQGRGAVRENAKGWPETQRPTSGQLNQDRFGEAGYSKSEYPEYEFERRGLPRSETGDARKGNGGSDERMQRYGRQNGYDARPSTGARPVVLDGQGYSRASGPGRGGALPVDPESRGRGEARGRRMDPRMVEGPDGIRTHRIGVGLDDVEAHGFRVQSRIPGREIGSRGVRMDSRGMGPEGRGLGADGRGVGGVVRGSGVEQRAVRPDGAELGAGSRGLGMARDGGGEVRGRGSWENEDEEEYVWEDMRPQARGPEESSGDGGDRGGGSSGRAGMEAAGGLEDWRRGGSGPQSEQLSGSAGMRAALRRESEERSRLAVSRTMAEPDVEVNRVNFSMPLTSSSALPQLGAPPMSSQGAAAFPGQGQYGVRQSYPPTSGVPGLGSLALPLLQQQRQDDSSREVASSMAVPQVSSIEAASQLPMFSLSGVGVQAIAAMSQQAGQLGSGGMVTAFSQQPVAGLQGQASQFQQGRGAVSGVGNGQSDVVPLNPSAISELLKLVQQLPGSQSQMQQQQQQAAGVSQSQAQSVAAGQMLQSVPPLPSGPPPTFLATAMYNPAIQQGGQYPAQVVAGPMGYSSQQQGRLNQPPLPPGPPPASALTVNPVGGVNQFDTLFKSLMAQGLISGSGTSTTSVPAPGNIVPGGVNGVNASAAFFNRSGLQAASVQTFSFSTALVSSVVPVADSAGADADRSSEVVAVMEDPIGTELRPEVLKERHEVVLDALYSDFPRQCKTCGLRFLEQEAHSKHMDWHVSRNRRQKSQKKVSRKWFVSSQNWVSGAGASATESAPSFFAAEVGAAAVAKADEGEKVAVPADYNQSACALCGEPFDDFYSDEKDEWMYEGAVYMNVAAGVSYDGMDSAALGPIVHAKCQTESAATAALTEVSEEVQPELMAADSVRMEVDGSGGDDSAMLLLDNFDSLEDKDENGESESRKKRVRY